MKTIMTTNELLEMEQKIKQEKALQRVSKELGLDRPEEFHEKNRKILKATFKGAKLKSVGFYIKLALFFILLQCLLNLLLNGQFTLWADLSSIGF